MTVRPPFATTPPSGLPDLIEHDACALAAFATRDGTPSRSMLELALTSLQMMVHRSGSVDGEGDGSGLLVDLPRPAWRRRLESEGLDPAAADDQRFTVAHIFFDTTEGADVQVPRIEAVDRASTASRCSGAARARSTAAPSARARRRPRRSSGSSPAWPASRAARRQRTAIGRWSQIERELDCHVASFSANDVVYKVMGEPKVLGGSTPTCREPDFASSRIFGHNRYSTNTWPSFSRVQPFSILGHNGEINTIEQLRQEARMLGAADPRRRLGLARTSTARSRRLISAKGLSLLEAMEMACRRSSTRSTACRRSSRPSTCTCARRWARSRRARSALIAAPRDECVFSVDALGLRPLWQIETGRQTTSSAPSPASSRSPR